FFFSSRRRHTSWPRDWSSDVCSSDLLEQASVALVSLFRARGRMDLEAGTTWLWAVVLILMTTAGSMLGWRLAGILALAAVAYLEIGRASCRERVYVSWFAGIVNMNCV